MNVQSSTVAFDTLDDARKQLAMDRAVSLYRERRQVIPEMLMEIERELSRRRLLELPHLPAIYQPLRKKSRYKGAYGGRGSGKSHVFAELLLSDCLKEKIRAVCVREHQISLEQSVKRLIEDKIELFGVQKYFRCLDTHIETPFDGIIIFQGMKNHTADSIKSLEGYNRAWVEEAQSLSARSLMLLRPTIRAEDSEIWCSWNPRFASDPVDQMLRTEAPPNSVVIEANYTDNPFFPKVLRDEMEWDRSRDAEKYAHVWLGHYETKSEARVFKNFRVEPFETPATAQLYYGADWGYSVDPSVLIRCWISGRTLYIDHEAYQIGCEIDNLPALFDQVPGSRDWDSIADSARPETIAYLKRHGFPRMGPAKKGPDSVKEGVIFLQNYDIVIHPRCKHAIDEFTLYSYKVDRLTGVPTPILEDKKNHVIDSVRYATEKIRKPEDWITW